jgi:CubicO group peptidase (beta-lactamase class C family)
MQRALLSMCIISISAMLFCDFQTAASAPIPATSPVGTTASDPIQALVDATYADWTNAHPWAGVAVGVLTPSTGPAPRFFSYGVQDAGSGPAAARITADTTFAINSMTKVFTALELAARVVEGAVALNDTVQPFTPHTLPVDGAAQIEFQDLATHWAGLPVRPSNLPNPDYINYTDAMFFDFFAAYRFTDALRLRKQYLYSNCAFGLLARVLTERDGSDFARTMAARFFAPLRMTRSGLMTDAPIDDAQAVGHTQVRILLYSLIAFFPSLAW